MKRMSGEEMLEDAIVSHWQCDSEGVNAHRNQGCKNQAGQYYVNPKNYKQKALHDEVGIEAEKRKREIGRGGRRLSDVEDGRQAGAGRRRGKVKAEATISLNPKRSQAITLSGFASLLTHKGATVLR